MPTRQQIVAAVRRWRGTPYRHQASLRGVGTDCLGLIRGVWREVIGPEPETPPGYGPDWAEMGGQEALAEAARRHLIEIPCTDFKPGDVLLFRWRGSMPAKHAGIAATAETMVHAQEGVTVAEIALAPWWRRRIAFAFRFPGVSS